MSQNNLQQNKLIDTCPRCGNNEFKVPEYICTKCKWQDPTIAPQDTYETSELSHTHCFNDDKRPEHAKHLHCCICRTKPPQDGLINKEPVQKEAKVDLQDTDKAWPAKELREAIRRSCDMIDVENENIERYEQELKRRGLTS